MPHEASVWTETFRVRAYETDIHGHVSIQTLCNYLQEVAGNHAEALNVSVERLRPDHLAWVLARLHVKVSAYPKWGETVRIESWPTGEDGLYALRDFLVFNEAGQSIIQATSAWLVMQTEQKRPMRIPKYVRDIELPQRPRALKKSFEKLAPPSNAVHQSSFAVRYSDLDLNAHVNNTRYVEWLVESMPERIQRHHRLVELKVQFRNETQFGDTVQSRAKQIQQGDTLIFAHSLVTAADQRLVATAHTHWH